MKPSRNRLLGPGARRTLAGGLASAAIAFSSLFCTIGCSHALPRHTSARPDPPSGYTQSAFLGRDPISDKRGEAKLSPTCTFSEGVLSYRQGKIRKSVPLDVAIREPLQTVCSDMFSVIIAPKEAIVALGADPVLKGMEMLGMIGDRFVPANSYSVDIEQAAAEGITKVRINGNDLLLTTKRAIWELDMANPVQWRIY